MQVQLYDRPKPEGLKTSQTSRNTPEKGTDRRWLQTAFQEIGRGIPFTLQLPAIAAKARNALHRGTARTSKSETMSLVLELITALITKFSGKNR